MSKLKTFIFGASTGGRLAYNILQDSHNIRGFIDNTFELQGETLFDLPIFSPKVLEEREFDRVVIASTASIEIREQLLKMGVGEDKINVIEPATLSENAAEIKRYFFQQHNDFSKSEEIIRVLEKSAKLRLYTWPRRLRDDIREKKVLDLGCGTGHHGPSFLAAGAREYWGVDPNMKKDDRTTKYREGVPAQNFGFSPAELAKIFEPRLDFIRGDIFDLPSGEKFDVISARRVTEHIFDLREVLAAARGLLGEEGLLIFEHHNFYCWNGHHCKPKNINQIDPADQDQKKVMDWRHIYFDAPPDHTIARRLNKIRLDELKQLIAEFFEIITWDEHESEVIRGRNRLTEEILEKHQEFSKRELITQSVFGRARLKRI